MHQYQTACKLELNETEKKWCDLLTESCVWLSKYELFELIDDMQKLNININTLSFQMCADGSIIARIDTPTKQYYQYAIQQNTRKD